MPGKAKELSALEVSRLTSPGLYAAGVVPGLQLQVTATGARTWVLRVWVAGRRRDMGLGGYPAVTLAMAREKAREARDKIDRGIDPIGERRAAQSTLRAARGAEITFEKAAQQFIEAKSAEWRNTKHRGQWEATLSTYAFPVIGTLQVRDVALPHVVRIHSREMPARRGHQVTALLLGERLVGLYNGSTGKQVNFVRADPPLPWRRCDAAAVAAPSAASIAAFAFTAWPAVLVSLPLALLCPPLVVTARFAWRCRTRAQVDRALDIVKGHDVVPPQLRRVK
ncbi:MAG: DUF4102 domain-containing protein [Rhodocyclaceae bacterium]|nr:DUF4102 domain-containing protein [Rhodocyclaceae bacterium]